MQAGKTILVISPQSWGNMFISKHHYAMELARRGNFVYFLNPPDQERKGRRERIAIRAEGNVPNLWVIDHSLLFPYQLKFHAMPLFHLLMRPHVGAILRKIGRPVDIVWSFDLGNFYPFRFFGSRPVKIFHPVDEPLNDTAIRSGEGAGVIFSVTREILAKYAHLKVPAHFINHGVSEDFVAGGPVAWEKPSTLRVGLSGNWTRPDIDTGKLLAIIKSRPSVLFEFWGSYRSTDSNIGGSGGQSTEAFIRQLQESANVILHGPVPSRNLATELKRMDAFLICYDIRRDQSKGTNYHKVMEYLSTGRVIISNNITTYSGEPDLVNMITGRDNNDGLPALFDEVMDKIADHNSPALQRRRFQYALENTYPKQVQRIADLLDKSGIAR